MEFEWSEQAEVVISTISKFLFMMYGMPRPVRARAAEAEMFADRPGWPDRRIQYTFIGWSWTLLVLILR
ncbi:hypothetical protein REPUB_Repub15cG0113000 [Reevesia pubescens]